MLEIPHKRVSAETMKDILMMLAVEEDAHVTTTLTRIGKKYQKVYSVDFTPVCFEKGMTQTMVLAPWYRRIRGDKVYMNTAFFNRWAESSWRKQALETRKARFFEHAGVTDEPLMETLAHKHT